MNIRILKSGTFFELFNYIFLIIAIEKITENKVTYYKIEFIDLETGKIRVEPFYLSFLKKLNIKILNLKYITESDKFYVFNLSSKNINIKKEHLYKYIEFLKKGLPISTKIKVKPIYVNYNWKNLKPNTFITLNCKTKNAKIYYTIDGSNPKLKGRIYNKPILIENNTIIKAYGVKKHYEDSKIFNFNCKINSKKISIYLSPSSQINNLGIEGSGYTTEEDIMNKIADIVEKILIENGVKVLRNNPNTFIKNWAKESNENKVDLHFAIHSNGSAEHYKKGMEVWINEEMSETYSLASMLMDNLYSIYHNQKDPITYRGVKYAGAQIAEVNPQYVPFGILIEIAYHDNLEDAKWIMSNIDTISKNIANSLLEYYQIK
jgi:N-acetylmuramoyl-L-alanine amidase